ncbi:M28 family peptidase [Terriglobus roseus]|uniref:M28 family peptidase n=1 Tax=Terriglobus roseus TaxID=392734 RepID=UPI001FCD5B5E|nr:M28 family peptidase [Terriglobus roseus]
MFSAFLLATTLSAQTELTLPTAAQAAAKGIDAQRLREHVKTLSSDAFEGRAPGQPGGEKAAQYIANAFKAAGLQPAGDNGTYFQKVPLVGVKTRAAETKFALVPEKGAPMDLTFGTDYVTNNQVHTESADIDAPIVFVGHGIVAPEYDWDDYKGIDVKGKVALVVVNEPASEDPKFFNGKSLTYYGRWTYKFEEAGRHGAVGVLIIHRTDLASYGWQVVQNSWSGEHSYLRNDPDARLKAASWIQHSVADKLLASIGMTADEAITASDKRGFTGRDLPVRLKAHVASEIHNYESANVIAKITGAKPGRDVLYTAHYDHFGVDHTRTGDPVFHGAADNATGTAIVMEMARAYATAKVQAPSTVIFAAVTGEEQGLLGSEFLGKHLPVPAREVSLDLNYDELLPLGDVASVSAGGAQRTTVYPLMEELSKQDGLELRKGGVDAGGGYYRSDHFSLARVGIPAFSVGQGNKFVGHDEAWARAQEKDFNESKYHTPADIYSDSMDFTGNARIARFGFELGWLVMNQPKRVEWVDGDEFAAARKKSDAR